MLAACRLPALCGTHPFSRATLHLLTARLSFYALVAYRCTSRALSAYALLHQLNVLTHPSGDRFFGFIVIPVPGVHL